MLPENSLMAGNGFASVALNVVVRDYLESLGMKAKISHGKPSSTRDRTWRRRDGDVFAWKRP